MHVNEVEKMLEDLGIADYINYICEHFLTIVSIIILAIYFAYDLLKKCLMMKMSKGDQL